MNKIHIVIRPKFHPGWTTTKCGLRGYPDKVMRSEFETVHGRRFEGVDERSGEKATCAVCLRPAATKKRPAKAATIPSIPWIAAIHKRPIKDPPMAYVTCLPSRRRLNLRPLSDLAQAAKDFKAGELKGRRSMRSECLKIARMHKKDVARIIAKSGALLRPDFMDGQLYAINELTRDIKGTKP